MKSWRATALMAFAWLSACIGGYEANTDLKCALGLALVFCALMDIGEAINNTEAK